MIPEGYKIELVGAFDKLFMRITNFSKYNPSLGWLYLTKLNDVWELTASGSSEYLTDLFEIALELCQEGIRPSSQIPEWEQSLWSQLSNRTDISHNPFKKESQNILQELKNNDKVVFTNYHF